MKRFTGVLARFAAAAVAVLGVIGFTATPAAASASYSADWAWCTNQGAAVDTEALGAPANTTITVDVVVGTDSSFVTNGFGNGGVRIFHVKSDAGTYGGIATVHFIGNGVNVYRTVDLPCFGGHGKRQASGYATA